MRSAKNFRAVKDYGAAKGILVAMAIGAIASGQVILSLVNVPIDQASVVLQTLAAPAESPIEATKTDRVPRRGVTAARPS